MKIRLPEIILAIVVFIGLIQYLVINWQVLSLTSILFHLLCGIFIINLIYSGITKMIKKKKKKKK